MARVSPVQMMALETAGVFEPMDGDGQECLRAAIKGNTIRASAEVAEAINQISNDLEADARTAGPRLDPSDRKMYRADSRSLSTLYRNILKEIHRA